MVVAPQALQHEAGELAGSLALRVTVGLQRPHEGLDLTDVLLDRHVGPHHPPDDVGEGAVLGVGGDDQEGGDQALSHLQPEVAALAARISSRRGLGDLASGPHGATHRLAATQRTPCGALPTGHAARIEHLDLAKGTTPVPGGVEEVVLERHEDRRVLPLEHPVDDVRGLARTAGTDGHNSTWTARGPAPALDEPYGLGGDQAPAHPAEDEPSRYRAPDEQRSQLRWLGQPALGGYAGPPALVERLRRVAEHLPGDVRGADAGDRGHHRRRPVQERARQLAALLRQPCGPGVAHVVLHREHRLARLLERRMQRVAVSDERGQLGAGPGHGHHADEDEQRRHPQLLECVVVLLRGLIHRSTPVGVRWSMAAVLAPLRCSAVLNEATGSSSG